MKISLSDFTFDRLAAVFADRFPRIIFLIAATLTLTLAAQLWWYITDEGIDTSTAIELDMRIIEGQWQWEPDEIVVPSGATVALSIENEDSFDHGFAVAELGIDERVPGGQTTDVVFVADIAPGEYDFYCSVFCGAGHFGQRGTLIVTEAEDDFEPGDRVSDHADVPVRSREDAIDELPYEVADDGVKEFHLTVEEVMWDYGDGNPVYSWGYNGQLPGPDIRLVEGDDVRIVVENKLPEDATSLHWHGVDLDWAADGVPGLTQDPIGPGETYTYEFTAEPAGTRFYHTHGSHHGDEGEQMDMGLSGAFIIEPAEYEAPDVEVTWVLTERIQQGIYPIHGAVYPTVPPIEVTEGDTVRVRMINAGSATFHPMHLHGHQYRVVAIDGNPVPEGAQQERNNQTIMPGDTYDIEFVADNPGAWLFHCHQLQHAAGGMIAEVHYEGFEPPDFSHGEHEPALPSEEDAHEHMH